MSENVTLRRATAADEPVMMAILETANFHHIPSKEMPELDIDSFFVAEMDGVVVGLAGYKVLGPGEGKTTLMVVLPEYRRYGVGRMLQERRMDALRGLGVRRLTTNADIPQVIEWYKRNFGYEEVGRLAKEHEYGRPDVHEWTTLRTDLDAWAARRAASGTGPGEKGEA